jgi:hypothetical protein
MDGLGGRYSAWATPDAGAGVPRICDSGEGWKTVLFGPGPF